MLIYSAKNYEGMSTRAADIISAQLIVKPTSVLGLATGSSPEGTYKEIINKYNEGKIDLSQAFCVNLDEYQGLTKDNPQSYAYFMKTKLFDHVNIKPENTYIPNGMESDEQKECSSYNNIIKTLGGIDLQLLGIGGNGHIGFNEPDNCFTKGTHLVKLRPETIDANSRYFNSIDDVPRYAYSMGIKNILQSKKIILIASGKVKSNALYEAIYGPITPNVPASILQLHSDVTIIADEDALSVIIEKGLLKN